MSEPEYDQLPHLQDGVWPQSGNFRQFVRCIRWGCGRSQTIKDPRVRSANFLLTLGWGQTADGWVCPICSDAGQAKLRAIFSKTAG